MDVALIVEIMWNMFLPLPHQQELEEKALSRGWNIWTIRFTRATQHFTRYAEIWLVAAFWTENLGVWGVAYFLQMTMAVLFHAISFVDPELLSHHDPNVVHAVTKWFPPRNPKQFLVYCVIQYQHTLCPLMAWWYVPRPMRMEFHGIILSILLYLIWNHICWLVQGAPPYPIQEYTHLVQAYSMFILSGLVFVSLFFSILTTDGWIY